MRNENLSPDPTSLLRMQIPQRIRHPLRQVPQQLLQIPRMPQRLRDIRAINRKIVQLLWREAGTWQIDALDRSVKGVLEETGEGDVGHGADVVSRSTGGVVVGRENDIRGIERGGVGPGTKDFLVEDAVFDGGVEGLDAPMQCALRRSGHDIAAYSASWIVAAIKDDTTECQYGIRDTLENRLFRIWSREIRVRETGNDIGIVAPKGLIPLQRHDAHVGGFPIIARKGRGGCVVVRDLLVHGHDVQVARERVGAADAAGGVGSGDYFALFGDLCRNIVTDTTKAKGVRYGERAVSSRAVYVES